MLSAMKLLSLAAVVRLRLPQVCFIPTAGGEAQLSLRIFPGRGEVIPDFHGSLSVRPSSGLATPWLAPSCGCALPQMSSCGLLAPKDFGRFAFDRDLFRSVGAARRDGLTARTGPG